MNPCIICKGKCCKRGQPHIHFNELTSEQIKIAKNVYGDLYRVIGGNKCVFLSDKGCTCKIKPLSCEIYPFLPTKNGWVVRTSCPYWNKWENLPKIKKIFKKRINCWDNKEIEV